MKRKILFISDIVLQTFLLLWLSIAAYGQQQCTETEWFTFNTNLGQGENVMQRRDDIIEKLKDEDADVVCLQEVWSERDIRQVQGHS